MTRWAWTRDPANVPMPAEAVAEVHAVVDDLVQKLEQHFVPYIEMIAREHGLTYV